MRSLEPQLQCEVSTDRIYVKVAILIVTRPSMIEILKLRGIAEYQFGRGVGRVLIPDDVLVAKSPNTLRIRQVILEGGGPIASLRAQDYLFSLHILGGDMLRRHFKPPTFRVIVSNDAARYVAEGMNVFAKHVLSCDPRLRAGSEVVVVDPEDNLLGVGRLKLSPLEIKDFTRGEAVRIRHSIKRWPP